MTQWGLLDIGGGDSYWDDGSNNGDGGNGYYDGDIRKINCELVVVVAVEMWLVMMVMVEVVIMMAEFEKVIVVHMLLLWW